MAFQINRPRLSQIMETYRRGRETNFPNTMREIGQLEGLLSKLQTSVESGISPKTIEARIETFGENAMPTKPPPTYLQLAWEALHDETLIMLIIAAIISLILGFAFEEDPSEAWYVGAVAG